MPSLWQLVSQSMTKVTNTDVSKAKHRMQLIIWQLQEQ